MIGLSDSQPSYKRLLLSYAIVLLFIISFSNLLQDKRSPSSTVASYQSYYTTEGYIVGKRFGKLWVTDSPFSLWERIKSFITDDYGQSLLIVSIHSDSKNQRMFDGLKINQKVRIYGDSFKESNPAQTSAYHIEIIKDE